MPSKKPSTLPAAAPPPAEPAKGAGLVDLARERPGLVIGGGLLAGLLVGVLMPRGTARKLAKGAVGAAALGSELGLSLARQAREGAGEASEHLRSGAERAGAGARRLREGTAHAASNAGTTAIDLARAGLNLLASLKR